MAIFGMILRFFSFEWRNLFFLKSLEIMWIPKRQKLADPYFSSLFIILSSYKKEVWFFYQFDYMHNADDFSFDWDSNSKYIENSAIKLCIVSLVSFALMVQFIYIMIRKRNQTSALSYFSRFTNKKQKN